MAEDEFQLPALPSRAEPLLPPPSFRPANLRKRSTRSDELANNDFLSTSLHTSSDPALFSSDEDQDVENYSPGRLRKKKRYAGTWWGDKLSKLRYESTESGSESSIRKAKKRKFTRNMDSGIFMCSDDASADLSSDSSFAADLLEEQEKAENTSSVFSTPQQYSSPARAALIGSQSLNSSFDSSQGASPQRKRVRHEPQSSSKQDLAISIIRKCLDESKEDVDLSNMALDTVPDELRELATMVKHDTTDSAILTSLRAHPRLYLSSNALRQFPSSIFSVRHLRLLSIRQNKLSRLPPGIRNLTKLETLNISGNRFQTLPIEVLDLMVHHRLSELHSEPNPWRTYRPNPADHNVPSLAGRRLSYENKTYRNDLELDISAGLVAARADANSPAITTKDEESSSKVAPLSELVLRELAKLNPTGRDLNSDMPEDTPETVTTMLNELHQSQADGNRQCVACKKQIVRPARTWTEWWRVWVRVAVDNSVTSSQHRAQHSSDQLLPFEVAVCHACT